MDFSDDKSWDRIVDAIDIKYGLTDHGRGTEPLPDRADLTQAVQYVVFARDGKSYKLERVTGPAIVDRKSHYHKSSGQAQRFENIYDEHEISHKTNFYVKSGADWQPINPEDLTLN